MKGYKSNLNERSRYTNLYKRLLQVEILNKHSVGVNYYNKGRLDLKNSQE